MKSRRQRAHPQGTDARNRMVRRPAMGVAREAAPDLSRQARGRLAMIDWHRANGANVSRTARHFGYSRPTVYRWLARFDGRRLETLEDRPSRPRGGAGRPGAFGQHRRGAAPAPRLPALGQGQPPGPAAAGGPRALGLDGRAEPRAPPAQWRAAGARPTPDQRPEARLAAAARRAHYRSGPMETRYSAGVR